MNKAELIDAMAEKAGLTKVDAGKALEAMMETTIDTLKKGDKVTLIGFGTFSSMQRAARKGRNPKTGKTIKIAAKKVAKFVPGKDLKDLVNGSGCKKCKK